MFLLYGFGVSIRSVARYLESARADFVIYDDSEVAINQAKSLGYKVMSAYTAVDHNGNYICGNGSQILTISAAITSPGTNKLHQIKIPIYNDIGLFFKLRKPIYTIGITGSFGKSTATALTAHIYNKCIGPAQFGGNIGVPIFDCDPGMPLVLEISSYQLELAKPKLEIAALLHICAQHLSRHGSLESYRSVKFGIFNHAQIKIVNSALISPHQTGYQTISIENIAANYALVDQTIYENGYKVDDVELHSIADISLIGAYAICRNLGLNARQILDAMQSFSSLPHRCEIVYNNHGKLLVNDSKSTNLLNSLYCLNRFKGFGRTAWIAGGKFADQDLSILSSVQVDSVFTIGEAGGVLADYLQQLPVQVARCDTLDEAMSMCLPYQTVLLSPGYSSFDMYKNFEERGEHFKRLVASLYSMPDN